MNLVITLQDLLTRSQTFHITIKDCMLTDGKLAPFKQQDRLAM